MTGLATRNGRLRQLKLLGSGGYADVYLCEQLSPPFRLMAVTVLRPQRNRNPLDRARLERELRVVASLQHPNIIQAYGSFLAEDGRTCIEFEYLSDGSLAERMDNRTTSPVSNGEAIEIVLALGRAIRTAHLIGVVHRDIKPSNVMFRDRGTPVLCDFGIAQVQQLSTELTSAGAMIGSLPYASPEQVQGADDVGFASDVYSLAFVLFELLAGEPPLSFGVQPHALSMINTIVNGGRRRLNSSFGGLSGLVDRALSVNPTHRPDLPSFIEELGNVGAA